MLISKVSEEAGGGEGKGDDEHASEYQTASELFDLMTRNSNFDANDDDSLSTGDLVLLYKNIDIGTKLMNDATRMQGRRPNQHVETVVYNDEHDSETDLSEINSAEDIQNVFWANQETLDFINDKSLENLLCHKFGGLEIQSSNISTVYDRNFLFKDPYIKNQLKNLNIIPSTSEFDNTFSTSLIDYICCKRLEDNYNFYMDNIIRYVQVTIEQLKRISNGDYLTDRAKEKWREVKTDQQENNTKVLATSTSIPLSVQCKGNENATWDDIVHSAVDVRSLSKILEKKIVVEIPKLICGSYRLYSKQCDENIIISCQREPQKVKQSEESRVDVVLKLQRSQSGQVMSNISSIMILRMAPASQDLRSKEILPLPFKEESNEDPINECNSVEHPVNVFELKNYTDAVVTELERDTNKLQDETELQVIKYQDSQNDYSIEGTIDYPISEFDRNASCDFISNEYSSESSLALGNILDNPMFPKCADETPYNIISPDELRMTMHRLNMQSSALDEIGEESGTQRSSPRRRSPVRVRIKSPYENKSFILEEKKRIRLLEIRERRERRKMALSENCKISKHKYGKGAIMPQASSSVTKLSITNKSFYNSIYGHSISEYNKPKAERARKGQKAITIPPPPDVTPAEQSADEFPEPPIKTPDKNSRKYINRSYYLDDTETAMMYMQLKQNENKDIQDMFSPCSASNSVVSNEFEYNVNLLTHFGKPSNTNVKFGENYLIKNKPPSLPEDSASTEGSLLTLPIADCVANPVSMNTTNDVQLTAKKSSTSSDECRKSIDKLYELIKKNDKPNFPADLRSNKSKVKTNVDTNDETGGGSTIQGSDSGTSVKHHITSSNPSCISGEKNDIPETKFSKNQAPVLPKVIISPKQQSPKAEGVKSMKKDRRRVNSNPPLKGVQDNPLKAISQLLHEFDTVHKVKPKPAPEQRPLKRTEAVPNDVKINPRPGSFRRHSRLDHHLKEDQDRKATSAPNTANLPRDRRARPVPPLELARVPHPIPVEEKFDKTKKKLADIIDEAREARGEAVRGPSKPQNSRLNSLAQPKRSYVQAHHDEYQSRYGRNVVANRLQRPMGAPESPKQRPVVSPVPRPRSRRPDMASANQPPPSSHLDRGPKPVKTRRSNSSSPNKPSENYVHAPTAPETLSKKMVAVESYLKSHYGRPASPGSDAKWHARVPLVPLDLDLASMSSSPTLNEACELGNTLHRMINSMLARPGSLTALAEGLEPGSRASGATPPRDGSESDFCAVALEENLETVVEHIADDRTESQEAACSRALDSTAELERLESALYNQISGAFQKRLRIKTLTLTPKHSTQRMFLVQSGDVGSVLLESTVSDVKLNERAHDLKAVPVLSSGRLDWNFAEIPVQISTVGYAFPDYCARNPPNSQNITLEASRVNFGNTVTSEKFSQYFREIQQTTDADAQVVESEFSAELVTVSVAGMDSAVAISQLPFEEDAGFTPTELETVEVKISVVDNNGEEARNPITEDINVKLPDESAPKRVETDPRTVEFTSSLDVLVGLLNEIQKITCQNRMDSGQNCSDLQMFLDGTAVIKKPNKKMTRDLVSITSLDNLRQLESDPSIYSFYVSNDSRMFGNNVETEPSDFTEVVDRSTDMPLQIRASYIRDVDENIAVLVPKPFCVDKEVSAYTPVKEYVDNVTDVPSSLVPLAIGQSAASSQSIVCCTDYQVFYASSAFKTPSIKKIIESPRIKRPHVRISRDNSDLNETCFKTTLPSAHNKEDLKKDRSLVARSELRKYCVKNIDLDPMLKIKRDILVTVYSILVLTIFAALSFPELILLQ